MSDQISAPGSMEKLNEYNYRDWRTCIKSYLRGQDLWDIVDGDDTSPPTENAQAFKKWNIKAGKALYVIQTTIDKSLLSRIEDAETPKQAWDALAALFSKKNAARLQLLERELMNTSQGTQSISDYFQKVRSLCREIEQLDTTAKIGEDRMRRIICNGLKPEYTGFITAIQGWPVQPSLNELENILANQEALLKQIAGVSLKNNNEEALFNSKRRSQGNRRSSNKYEEKKSRRQLGSSNSGGAQRGHGRDDRRARRSDECFNCGKKGHFARDCWSKKNAAQGNLVTSKSYRDVVDSEEEWDAQASSATVFLADLIEEEEDFDEEDVMIEPDEKALAIVDSEAIYHNNDWIVDSGFSNHICGDNEKLQTTSEYKEEKPVLTAKNSKLPIIIVITQ